MVYFHNMIMKYVCVWPLLLLVATGINVIETRKPCKGPRNIRLTVENFESIIKWKEWKCASPNASYTVDACYSVRGVENKCNWKGRKKWVEYGCNKLQQKKKRFICSIKLDPEMSVGTMLRVCRRSFETKKKKVCEQYGRLIYTISRISVFTEPNISSPNAGASSHQASITIQEPTGKYLRYFSKIQYEVIAVELNKISNATKCPKPYKYFKKSFQIFKGLSINSTYLNASCSETPTQEDHAVSYWPLDGLTPNTIYCVYARYNTYITENPNGPSQVGMLQVKTAGNPWQPSTAFIASLSVGIMIVIVVGSTTAYRVNRFCKSIKDPIFTIVDVDESPLQPVEAEAPPDAVEDVNDRVRNNRCDVLNHEYHHLDRIRNPVETERNTVMQEPLNSSSPGASGTISEGSESSVGTYVRKEGTQYFRGNSGDIENTDAAAPQQERNPIVTEQRSWREPADPGQIDTCSGFIVEAMDSSIESESIPLLKSSLSEISSTDDTSEMTENQATPNVNTVYLDADHFSN